MDVSQQTRTNDAKIRKMILMKWWRIERKEMYGWEHYASQSKVKDNKLLHTMIP